MIDGLVGVIYRWMLIMISSFRKGREVTSSYVFPRWVIVDVWWILSTAGLAHSSGVLERAIAWGSGESKKGQGRAVCRSGCGVEQRM